jgi:hypothetical protein
VVSCAALMACCSASYCGSAGGGTVPVPLATGAVSVPSCPLASTNTGTAGPVNGVL